MPAREPMAFRAPHRCSAVPEPCRTGGAGPRSRPSDRIGKVQEKHRKSTGNKQKPPVRPDRGLLLWDKQYVALWEA